MKINGVPVVDATRRLQLHITRSDVNHGDTKDPAACAAARSICRMPEVEQARVHVGRTYIKMRGGKWVRYQTPKSLRTEIVAFDRGGKFEPGDYELVPLPPSAREGRGKRMGSSRGENKPKTKRAKRRRHMTTGIRAHGANR